MTTSALRRQGGGQPDWDRAELEREAAALRARTVGVYERFGKVLVDRLLAAVLLIVLSPIMACALLAVLASVGRPILYGQCRVGRHGVPFTMLKFRTMHTDRRVARDRRRWRRRRGRRPSDRRADHRRVTHKTLDDPRHTPIGRVLRKTSIDELPQLLNVLRGDMSLVGPRPELCDVADGFDTWQQARHLVRPGITGLWQTTERGRGRLLHECVELDLEYIGTLSAMTDLRILLRTPLAVLRSRSVI